MHTFRKHLSLAAALALLCLFSFGCAPKTEEQPKNDTAPQEEPAAPSQPDSGYTSPQPLPDPEPEFVPAMSVTDGKGVYYIYVDKNGVADPYMILDSWHGMTDAEVVLPHTADEIALTHIQRAGSGQPEECTSIPAEAAGAALVGIDDEAFYGCSLLSAVTVPDSVEFIGSYAFAHCKSLEGMVLPESLTRLGEGAFFACAGLSEISIPADVNEMGARCFSGCTALAAVGLNCGGISSIEDGLFENCAALNSVNIPDGVSRIGYRAFYGCAALEDITLPSALLELGDEAFCGSGLKAAALPDGLQHIGSYAFRGTQIGVDSFDGNLPKSVVSVGANPYADTPWMEPVRNDGGFLTLRGGYTFLVAYTLDSDEVNMFPGIHYICPFAFEGTRVKAVIISDDVVAIGEGAFKNCTRLESVTLGSGVTAIGSDAFYGCTALREVSLNNGLQTLGDNVFWNCGRLLSLTLPDSIVSIDEHAFHNCPASVICSDGSYARSRCEELGIPLAEGN